MPALALTVKVTGAPDVVAVPEVAEEESQLGTPETAKLVVPLGTLNV